MVATETVARWAGRALDPVIAARFLDSPAELLAVSSPDDVWAAVVDAEPAPRRTFHDVLALDDALAGFGDAADLKSPWFTGHSGGVARLARAAAEQSSPADTARVYRAGLLHDLGRVAVPTGVWERRGPLRPEEWELVRPHPYHSGRILARSPVLAPLGSLTARGRKTIHPDQLTLAMEGEVASVFGYSFILTDIHHQPTVWIEHFHRHRAQIEERLKEAKLGRALRHLPSGNANANRVWLTAALLALNLTAFRSDLCPAAGASGKAPDDAPLRRAAATLRRILFNVPGRIIRSGRRTILRRPHGFRHAADFRATLDAVYALPPP